VTKELQKYVKNFKKGKVLVVGDIMLDHFIWGQVDRISPEAPVPVVKVSSESYLLGGAANVYHNILKLGGEVTLCGIVGDDDSGLTLLGIIKENGGHTNGLFTLPDHPTTKKTRIVAHGQQVVRFDHEKFDPLSPEISNKILSFIEEKLDHTDCIVLSDYAKGLISPKFMEGFQAITRNHQINVIADPKIKHMGLFQGSTLITPNHLEASKFTGIEINGLPDIISAGKDLLNKLNCEAVLITRGEQGMSLFEREGKISHIPTMAKEVYDVTGAGDTVVAVLALSLAVGASFSEAAMLSNIAASAVVGIVGTATIDSDIMKQLLQ